MANKKHKRRKKGLYQTNKEAKVHEIIECPVCHTKFEKIQWMQAFCCSQCKDKFHNMRCKDRHRYAETKEESYYSFSDEAMDLEIADFNTSN